MLKTFDSDLEAIDYCCNIHWEVVYSSESHRFYASGYDSETSDIVAFKRSCCSPFGSSEFYSEANEFCNDLEDYNRFLNDLEVFLDA